MIKKRLENLYPGQNVYKDLQKILKRYKEVLAHRQNTNPLTSADSMLITYPDQISGEQGSPLRCQHEFLKLWVGKRIPLVHILPFYTFTSDDGFSVVDYLEVHPDYGDWTDIRGFSKDYGLMFDAVFNHVSSHSKWVTGYLSGDPNYDDFCISVDPQTDLSGVIRPRALPLLTLFNSFNGPKHLWTTFSEDQVDVNIKNPKVLLSLIETLLFYVSQGARLIRLDAIAFLWKEIGTNCMHLQQTHEVVKLFRDCLNQVAPDTLIITETNVPHEENISYFGENGDEAQLVYQFPLPPLTAHAILNNSSFALQLWASGLELPNKLCTFFNTMASHDGIGVRGAEGILSPLDISFLGKACEERGGKVNYKNNLDGSQSPYELCINFMDLISNPDDEDDLRARKMLLAQSVLLCMPGLPGIYFHSLFGSRNDHAGVETTGANRSINREKLTQVRLEKELKNGLRPLVFQPYMDMLEIRANQLAFDPYGDFEFPVTDESIFCILRSSGGQKLACIHNFSDSVYDANRLLETIGFDPNSGLLRNRGAILNPFDFEWFED
ncbi:MAG: alpha-amylase family glycosyl hydrolase [bacterium]|nr:alpha-amylase family glycosyl hydrolase [bacterium]